MKKQIISIIMLVVISAVVFPAQNWRSKFDSVFYNTEYQKYLNYSTSSNSNSYYYLGPGIDATVAMYRATGVKSYIDDAINYVENVIADAQDNLPDSSYPSGYKGWIGTSNGNPDEYALYESYLWRYVCRLLRVIKENPTLYNDTAYRTFFDETLAFTEKNIWEKWYSRGIENLYRKRTHMASHWGYIAFDLFAISSDSTKKTQYSTVYKKINTDLRANLQTAANNSNAYFWNQTWDTPTTSSPIRQDTSHGNNVLSYVVACYDKGVFWTKDNMVKFIITLKELIWNPADIDFHDFVDGTYGPFDNKDHTGRFQSDGWVKLGKYSRAIQDMYEFVVINKPNLFSLSSLPQLYANLALNEAEFREILAPGSPSAPVPGNNASEVPIEPDYPLLKWGECANTSWPYYRVYFGTSSNPPCIGTIADAVQSGNREFNLKADGQSLLNNTQYYWRVESVGVGTNNKKMGPLWKFKTKSYPVPGVPKAPFPCNYAENVSIDPEYPKLTWGWCANTAWPRYRIYFGTTTNPPCIGTIKDAVQSGNREFNLKADGQTLLSNTWYYWQVESVGEGYNNRTMGPLWRFKTK